MFAGLRCPFDGFGRDHKEAHPMQEQQYRCDRCQQNFQDREQLERHNQQQHKGAGEQGYGREQMMEDAERGIPNE
jgi:hypothetical protein